MSAYALIARRGRAGRPSAASSPRAAWQVGGRRRRARRERADRDTFERGVVEAGAARDLAEHQRPVELPLQDPHRGGRRGAAAVDERRQQRERREAAAVRLLGPAHLGQHGLQRVERQVAGGDRDHDRIRRRQRRIREGADRGRGVEQDHVPAMSLDVERALQPVAARRVARQRCRGLGEVAPRGNHGQPAERIGGGVADGPLALAREAGGGPALLEHLDAERPPGRALRVQVHDQRPLPVGGERPGEGDRRRGLADAALAVDDGYHVHRASVDDAPGVGDAGPKTPTRPGMT